MMVDIKTAIKFAEEWKAACESLDIKSMNQNSVTALDIWETILKVLKEADGERTV